MVCACFVDKLAVLATDKGSDADGVVCEWIGIWCAGRRVLERSVDCVSSGYKPCGLLELGCGCRSELNDRRVMERGRVVIYLDAD